MSDMLSAQKQAFKCLCIKQGNNNIKLLHSLGLLIAPFGEEYDYQHHNNYIVFKGGQTKQGNPASLYLIKECLLSRK